MNNDYQIRLVHLQWRRHTEDPSHTTERHSSAKAEARTSQTGKKSYQTLVTGIAMQIDKISKPRRKFTDCYASTSTMKQNNFLKHAQRTAPSEARIQRTYTNGRQINAYQNDTPLERKDRSTFVAKRKMIFQEETPKIIA